VSEHVEDLGRASRHRDRHLLLGGRLPALV
jgi:hypothetical protein